MNNIPNKIYLQVDPEEEGLDDFKTSEGVTWCGDRIYNNDVEYIRPETLYEKIRELPHKIVVGIDSEEGQE